MEYRDTKKDVIIRIGGSIVIGYLFPGVFFADECPLFSNMFWWSFLISALISITVWQGLTSLITYLQKKLPWQKQPLKRFIVQLIFTLIISFGVIFAGTVILHNYILEIPISEKDLYFTFYVSAPIVIIVSSILEAVFFLKSWRSSIEESEQLKRESAEAKYNALKSQVNPHFLFNSFNTLQALISYDKERAIKYVQELSTVFRYVLQSSSKDLVLLKEEMKIVNQYIFLLKTSYESSLIINMQGEPIPDKKIPPVALQVLIENAIKHNRISQSTLLQVNISFSPEYIEVSNIINPKEVADSHQTKTGLLTLKTKYDYLGIKGFKTSVSDNRFIVKLPLI